MNMYASFLNGWQWNNYSILTFNHPTNQHTADTLFRNWIKSIEQAEGKQVHYVRVADELEGTHYHTLLSVDPTPYLRSWGGITKSSLPQPYHYEYIGEKMEQGNETAFSKNLEKRSKR